MNQRTLRYTRYIGDAGTPAGSPIEQNDREETSDTSCDGASNDGFGLNSEERPLLGNLAMKHHGHSLRIGTWNVRTLYRAGSLDNCIREMEINRLDILGLSEVRWTETGRKDKDDYSLFFSGVSNMLMGWASW